jgi:hypothetical protein
MSSDESELAQDRIPVVFVHLGCRPPLGLSAVLQQAVAWHGAGAVTLIVDFSTNLEPTDGVQIVNAGEFHSTLTDAFRGVSGHDANFRGGFWRSTAERLFVLHAYMESRGLSEVLHFENDNLSFVDTTIEARLRSLPAGVSVPFVSRGRGVASIMYVSSLQMYEAVLKNFLWHLSRSSTTIEMELFALAKRDGLPLHALPTAPSESWVSASRYSAENPVVPSSVLWENFDRLNCLFDGSAVGHFLAGQDPANDRYVQRNRFRNNEVDLDVTDKRWLIRDRMAGLPELWIGDDVGMSKLANLHMHCKEFSPMTPQSKRAYERLAAACEENESVTSIRWGRMIRDLRSDVSAWYHLAYQWQYWVRSRRKNRP